MALHFYTQNSPGGGWSEVNLTTESIINLKHVVSYSAPALLTFEILRPEHELPFTPDTPLIFYDDSSQTFNDPNFEGVVSELSPASNNRIKIECYDNTKKMTKEVPIMSAPWLAGDFSTGDPPTEGIGALPRLVFNVTIDNDDDFAFARQSTSQVVGQDPTGVPITVAQMLLTIGDMIKIILDDAYEMLFWHNSANADGTSYVASELAQMVYRPQEKQVFESESIRSGLDRLLTQQPTIRYLWMPGPNNRKFKFIDARKAPAVTLTLNDFDGVTNPVLSMQMRRILDHVRTAVKVYGPESTATQTVSTSNLEDPTNNNGALVAFDSIALDTYGDGTGATRTAYAYRKYQIANPDRRRSANMLSTPYLAGAGAYNFFQTRSPTVEVSFDGGFSWMAVFGWTFDSFNGIIDFGNNYIYFWKESESDTAATRNFYTPTHVRFTHSYYTDPLSVRYPTEGFVGTGFTVAGLETVHRFYDEMLAVGYERGTAVTTASRVGQFRELCRQLSETYRDINYVGGATLEGIDYRFLRLNKRVNIASVDQDGNTIVTGWESVGAIVTEVEYDYTDNLTTISFSHDLADYLGWSIDYLKEQLKIKALLFFTQTYWTWSFTEGLIDFRFSSFTADPDTGQVEETIDGTEF